MQVDPTLRNLLAVLQRRQELFESSTTSNDDKSQVNQKDSSVLIGSSKPAKLEDEETILGLLQAEAELLMYLQKTLVEFPDRIKQLGPGKTTAPEDKVTAELNQQISEAMLILLDYISLPLVAILRRPLTTPKQQLPTDNDNSKQQEEPSSAETVNRRKLQIRQGSERKSIGIAARTLKLYLGVTAPKRDPNESSSSSESSSIPKQKILQLLLACSTALPTGQEITKISTEVLSGVDYLEAILDVVSFLLHLGSDTAVDPALVATDPRTAEGTAVANADFSEEVINAMDGSLVALVADACLSTLAPPSKFRESTILAAAGALQTLLSTVPDLSTWRALFPGCFAVSSFS